MAEETQPKRQRDQETLQDSHDEHSKDTNPSYKRQKPCNNNQDIIIGLLEDEQEQEEEVINTEPITRQDHLSAIFKTLQQELSFDFDSPAAEEAEPPNDHHQETTGGEDEGLKYSVMRHLLEASDDELGIPSSSTDDNMNHVEVTNSSEDDKNLMPFGLDDNGLMWELEDEAANYYTVLQSEFLFM